jgi:hypothetical protein
LALSTLVTRLLRLRAAWKVGEQAEVLAQAEDGLLGAQRPVQRVVLPVADGAEQDGVGFLREFERGVRQRVAVGVVGGAADQRGLGFELQVQRMQDLDGLGHNFGANAVTRQDCDFHFFFSLFTINLIASFSS